MLTPCKKWAIRLSSYLDNALTLPERIDVEAHLQTCNACRTAVELYRCDAQDITAALHRGASEDFAARVLEQVKSVTIEAEPVAQPAVSMPKPLPPAKPQRSVFSRFAEWAVVAAVIMVFAAILFPVFAKPIEKARQTTCTSQVRQLATAIQMYAQDNNGVYPPADHWVQAIDTYVGNSKMYHCPSDANTDDSHVSYAYNAMLSGKHQSMIPHPEDTVTVFDADNGQPSARHTGVIVGFADGHAKFVPGKTIDTLEKLQAALAGRPLHENSAPTHLIDGLDRGNSDDNLTNDYKLSVKASPSQTRVKQPTIAPPEKNYGLADKLQIAYTADLSMLCDDVQDAMERSELLIKQHDGFVLNSDFQRSGDDTATATISGRVPAEQLGTLLVGLDRLGKVVSRKVNGEDLTATHVENYEKLLDLSGSQGQLSQMRDKARSLDEKQNLEQQRESKANDANGLWVDEYKLKSRVTLADVTVQLASAPKPIEPPKKVNPLAGTARDAFSGLKAVGLWLGQLLIGLLIWAPVWAPVLGITLYLRKRYWMK